MMPFLFNFFSLNDWQAWVDDHLLRLVVVLALLLIAAWLFRRFISRILSHAITSGARRVRVEDQEAVERRAHSLAATLNWSVGLILGFIGVGLVLSELGLNISALIAAAGVAGVAIGLGAQMLIRDVINGLFILIEDQYAVGDTVTVATVTGEVIEINPRRTVLRDAEGNIYTVPNSSITVATNRTAGLNRFVVELEVPFREADDAAALVSTVANEVMAEHAHDYQSSPRVLDVKAVNGGDVVIRVVGDARDGAKWTAEAELRRRLKRRFETESMEMEFSTARKEPEEAKA